MEQTSSFIAIPFVNTTILSRLDSCRFTLTKLGVSWMPALASTMELRVLVLKSLDTTASSV